MKTKILVIGAGGAGLTAAIGAARAGAEVWVASKTGAGMNTCTAYSGGVFTLASGDVSPQAHFEKTMEVGRHVNDPALVTVLAEQAEKSLREVASWGVDIRFPGPGRASVRHTAPYKLMAGEGMMRQLTETAKKQGVRFMEFTAATALRLQGSRIAGAELVNWRSGKGEFFAADAVILASGGGGRIYSRTDNPVRMTGDGYALALDAGLPLIDMEFTQFYPMGWADPELPVWMADLGLADHLRVTDAEGHEFLMEAQHRWGFKDGREGNLYARDQSSVLIAQTDRRGGAFVHFEDLTEEARRGKEMIRELIIDAARFEKIRRPVRIAPLQHYMCGGVKIDAQCRTAIPGLYACGEVTGGVDGANRIGGNALSNIVTFGLRAGKNAAAEAPRAPQSGAPASPLPFTRDGEPTRKLRSELQKKMWQCVGPLRTARSITEALDFLAEFRTRKMAVVTPLDLLEALEMRGLTATSEAVAKAALARKNSLGTHYREDSRR